MEINDFVWKFHNLPGRTLSEKQKNINVLLKDTPLDQDALLAAVAPKTHFENLFKLKILLKLQRVEELVQILKYEEEYLPAKLLQNKWFCRKLTSLLDENGSDFVNGILPFTSYVIRRRIVAKIATYGNRLDPVFDEFCTRYGNHLAKDLLVGCTAAKIDDTLKSEKVVLSPYCQKVLYQKHPQLFGVYLTQHNGTNVDESVIHYVARHNINNFLEMIEKFKNLSANLGKRLTKKLLNTHRETLIEKSETFSCILHLKTVVRVLKEEELKEFFQNSSPSSIDGLPLASVGFRNMRKHLGKRYYKFLSDLIKEKYKKSVYDFADLVDEEMMESMDIEEREKWIGIKKKKGASENDLVAFMKISDSVPLIKDKINVTSSVNGRENLVQLLLKTCKINGDYKALAEVAEYFCQRHRNDDCSVLRNFLYKMKLFFNLDKFDHRLWESVNSVINVLNRKGDESFFKPEFYVKYVEFLFRQNKLTDEHIYNFFNLLKRTEGFQYKTSIKELGKLLILKSVEMKPKLLKEGENAELADFKLISLIFQWNKYHPRDKISIFDFPRLVESFKKISTKAIDADGNSGIYNLISVFKTIICTKEESDLRTETIKNYFLIPWPYYELDIDLWLLKHQPEIIYENVEPFLKHLLSQNVQVNLLKYIKNYADPTFLEKVVTYCLNSIEQDDNLDTVFHTLAILEPPNRFLQHIAPFYPTEDKIGEDAEDERKGRIATSIAASFKFSGTPVLPELIKYCKGDYKNRALESLYYLFYHSPENQLSAFIEKLSSKAVSVRKHAIFLTCIVGSVEDVKKLLKQFIENERNVSVQKHLFTAALKYFIRNPSEDFWECVKICMTKLDRNDWESFNMLGNLRAIPEKYQARHVIFVWDILKKSEDLDKHHPRLLSSIPSSIFKDFPLEFLLEVISENFLRSEYENAINEFVVSSLTKSSFKEEILDTIFTIMTRYKTEKFRSLEQEKTVRNLLSSFIDSITYTFATGEENSETFSAFSQRWHGTFSATEAMREHLKLSFVRFYLESGKDLKKFSTIVAEFLENLVSTYGVVIVDCFALELKYSLKTFLFNANFNEEFFNFMLNILKNWNGLVFYLLVIKLLPRTQPSEDKAAHLFQQVVGILREVPQESIQMLMNLYVTDIQQN